MTPYEALQRAVDSNGGVGTPNGGVVVSLRYDPTEAKYYVDVDTGEAGCSACAPTLELALLALQYLDEGEYVELSEHGRPLCMDCHGDGCDECDSIGFDPAPPAAWPKGALRTQGEP